MQLRLIAGVVVVLGALSFLTKPRFSSVLSVLSSVIIVIVAASTSIETWSARATRYKVPDERAIEVIMGVCGLAVCAVVLAWLPSLIRLEKRRKELQKGF
jgi:hypothetical protein